MKYLVLFAVMSTAASITIVLLQGRRAIGRGWYCLNMGTAVLWVSLLWQAYLRAPDPTPVCVSAAVILGGCWTYWAHNILPVPRSGGE